MPDGRYRAAEARLWTSLGVEPTERRVRIAGSGGEVRVQEVGDGPPILFLHGASTAGSSWASLVAMLPGYRSLVPDRPGTGLSGPLPSPPRTVPDARALADRLVPDLLDALGVDRAAVVATSLGGWFAFRGSLAAPKRITALVELGWTPAAGATALPRFMRAGTIAPLAALMARVPATDTRVRRTFRAIGLRGAVDAGGVPDEAVETYRELLNDTPTMRHELALGRAMVSWRHGLRPGVALDAEELRRVTMPVLVAWGTDDPFGPPSLGARLVERLPNARLEVLADAGHAVWMDDAAGTARLIDDFLAASRR